MEGRFKILVYLILPLLLFTGCSSRQEFNSDKWKSKPVDWWVTDIRESMVDDLVQSDTLIGMNRSEVTELLGDPELNSDGALSFLVREKYSSNIDPDYIKHLYIEFNNGGIVKNCMIVQ